MNPLRPQMDQNPMVNQPQQPLDGPGNLMQRMIFNKLYQSNPQFRAFAQQMQGQNPEEAFAQQGLDYNQFRGMDPSKIKSMLGF